MSAKKCQHNANLEQLQKNLSPHASERMSAGVLRNKATAEGEVCLANTSGSPMTLQLKTPCAKQLFSATDMSNIQQSSNLSNRGTLDLAMCLSTSSNSRKVVEPRLKENLQKIDHSLDGLFDIKKVEFIMTEGTSIKPQKTHISCTAQTLMT